MPEFKLTEDDKKYNTLMEQLCTLGYEEQLDEMTKGMEIVDLIVKEHLDISKLTFPYGSFEAFTNAAQSGEYDLDDDEEINNPFLQYKTTKDYVRACLHGEIQILGIEPDEWNQLVKEIQDEESSENNINIPEIDLNCNPEEIAEKARRFDTCVKHLTEEELITGIRNRNIPGYIDENGKPIVLK